MNLLNTLPAFWQKDAALQSILAMIQPEIDRLETLKNEVLQLGAVGNASGWALEAWEAAFGIRPDAANSDAFRRSTVQTKMRSGGIVTPESIVRLMASYYGGEVTVTELPEKRAMVLTFVGQKGTPDNIEAVRAALDAVLPADLTYEFAYTYLLIHEVSEMTLAELSATTLDKFAGGTTYVQ